MIYPPLSPPASPPVAVDCVGSWNICDATCNKTYTITTPASGGGATCTSVNGDIQACTGGSCPAPGSCDNTTVNGCTNGSPINQVAGSCGGSANWNCMTAGGTSGQCSKANAICVVNGDCGYYMNSRVHMCVPGTKMNDNAQYNCGATRTWDCNGSGGGTNASCSQINAACTTTKYPGCDTNNIVIGSKVWATCNVGATNATTYGDTFTYEQAQLACAAGYHNSSSEEWVAATVYLGADFFTIFMKLNSPVFFWSVDPPAGVGSWICGSSSPGFFGCSYAYTTTTHYVRCIKD